MKKTLLASLALALALSCSIQTSSFDRVGSNDRALGQPSSTGSFSSGVYRNLFKEIGKSDAEIQAKLDAAWNQLFYGDDSNQRIYYPVGTDMAYIKDVGNNDVRSEGMSYGMTIAVLMNKKAEFDRLWKWSKTYMQQTSGIHKGYFAWQMNTDGSLKDQSKSPAPDGEEYFAMALFLASARWGDAASPFDYRTQANAILTAMLHQADDGEGWNMIDPETNVVVFVPYFDSAKHSDPSYVIPAFYDYWAVHAANDNARWAAIATKARQYLRSAAHPTTFLSPDYANFDGSPKAASWDSGTVNFRFDAWRVAQNVALDASWFAKDPWQRTYADGLQSFFASKGRTSYVNQWTLSGSPLSSDRSSGLIAMNAVASFAATKSQANDFLNDLWNLSVPSGQWRYYDGCLYMLALLHTSGKFVAYQGSTPSPSATPTTSASPSPSTVPSPSPSPIASPSPAATPTPVSTVSPPSSIKVQISGTSGQSSGNTIGLPIRIVNVGTSAVPLSEITVRYYFTKDTQSPLQFFCDYADKQSGGYAAITSSVSGRFVSVSSKPTADTYLEISFLSSAGSLAPNAYATVQTRIAKTDWSNFQFTNDYSAVVTNAFVDGVKTPGYRSGLRVWGIEP